MTQRSFTGKDLRAKAPLKLVHSNLCGPLNVKARGGYKYFISFSDDYSRYGHVYLIQNKSDSFENFKEYKAIVENESVARFFLGICFRNTIYILNNIPSKSVSETPYELWKGRKGYPKELKGACEAAKEAVWLKKFLKDLEVVPNMHLPITLYYDNSGAVANSREPRSHKRGKHIKRKYHLIREIVHRGDVIVTKISSEQNMANPFTKALSTKVFESHLHGLGLHGL
ncbi:retrovirus-related pol polyprotein from transposon tnt 1-94 [Cucumis melo var. makuwa]|uniref:Retrovirus-related pol polyprotein from transposon tnt 1-94 n=1 Tax=Cucumis melo var. makuwa TaxID=1194695 RepID=A0A5A7SNJ8_CUCMM|nr:retrovirus-related pol polyprotein from transposon tnt 1-94 [Cucumis melo var. makuwa]TYJ97311.1 retrovirus-related pol polyprotein from transposon tnt 1-94 [Cucumis melo var. makuwa]